MAYPVYPVYNRWGKFLRYFMFGVNFIIWLGSMALIVLGVWTAVNRPFLEQLIGSTMYVTTGYLLIITGFFIFFLSFLGCYGALREVKWMLLMYAIIIILLLIILVAGAILGHIFRREAVNLVRKAMKDTMVLYESGSNTPITKAWDDTQQALKCCAISEQSQWREFNKGLNASGKIPKSCCKLDDEKLMDCESNPKEDNSYKEGCFDKAKIIVKDNSLITICVSVAAAIIMALAFILAIYLFKTII
ncbi:tetraspanin-1-like [Panulirus ornatus]|uniref:tetraspanin-1-like n=1 Tax=Panulirus ornatus TaxID=150431 RepID=UPI003A83F90E